MLQYKEDQDTVLKFFSRLIKNKQVILQLKNQYF